MSRRSPRRFVAGETFAMLPTEVLHSDAYKALPDFAARVLIALAERYRGNNNGDLSLTKPEASKCGVTPPWKLVAGINLLVTRIGLVERTRTGSIESGKGISALYALGWLQIDPSAKHDVPSSVAHPAPNRWAKWRRPIDWDNIVDDVRRTAQGKKNAQSPRVYQAGQPGVSESHQKRTPRVTQERRFTGQPGVSPSQILAGGTRLSPDLEARIEKLIGVQPHLLNGDVAKILQTEVERVARVRERMTNGRHP